MEFAFLMCIDPFYKDISLIKVNIEQKKDSTRCVRRAKVLFESIMHALQNGMLNRLGFNNKSSCHSDFTDLGNDKLLGNFADNKFFS